MWSFSSLVSYNAGRGMHQFLHHVLFVIPICGAIMSRDTRACIAEVT